MKIVIIGGVAGGATAAARLRRLDEESEIIILERGPHVSFANCGLPYFVGGEIKDVDNLLLHSPKSLTERFNLDVRIHSEAIEIFPENNELLVQNKLTQEKYKISYDHLILATGASPIIPPLPGINSPGIFSVRTVPDVQAIKEYIHTQEVQSALVIGGGYIGIEIIEQLHNLGLKLSLVEAGPQILGPFDPEIANLATEQILRKNISLFLKNPVTAISKDQNHFKISLQNGDELKSEMIILAIGVKPESSLAKKSGIKIGTLGGVEVNDLLQTSVNNIWAIGDCIEVTDFTTGQTANIALAGPANRQARIVADNIYGANKKYQGTLGTAILRCFDLTLASVGSSAKRLDRLGIKYLQAHLHPLHHVGYYPGGSPISLKIIFSPEGKILGAQAAGKEGVDKRIDVIATAIKSGLDVRELIDLELCYAPPYGSAKDPVNIAGMIAENILNGKVTYQYSNQINQAEFLLDVRSKGECQQGTIPGSINIPLPELRKRLSELPKDREILVYCLSGQRSYFASRILRLNGFKVSNLSGAYKTYQQFTE